MSEMAAIEPGSLGWVQPNKHDINVGIRWEDDTTAPVIWRRARGSTRLHNIPPRGCIEGWNNRGKGGLHLMKIVCMRCIPIVTNGGLPDYMAPPMWL